MAAVTDAMRQLAASYNPSELDECAMRLFMQFKPDVPFGRAGWGAKGELKVEMILRLAKEG